MHLSTGKDVTTSTPPPTTDDSVIRLAPPRADDALQERESPPHIVALRHLRKHWLTALLVAIAVLMVVTFYTLGATRIYRAEATLRFDPNPPAPLGGEVQGVVDIGVGNYWNNQEYYQTQYEIITSQEIAVETVKQLALHRDPGFLANLPANAQVPAQVATEEDAAVILRGRLQVKPVKDSQLADVWITDANPERAAKILNTLVDVYVERNLLGAYDATDRAITELSSQLGKLETDLRTSEEELHGFKKEHDILSVALDDRSNMLLAEMQLYNEELARVRALQQEAAARHSVLSRAETDVAKLPAKELLASPVLQSLRQTYLDAVRERDALLASGKGPEHPDAKAAIKRTEAAKTGLLEEIANVKASTKAELAVLGQRAAGLKSLFEKAKSRALELNQLDIDYRRLGRKQQNLEKLYELVLNRTKESGLSRTTMLNNISVIDRARVPPAPILPRVPVNLGAGLLLGLLLGIAAAVGRGYLDRTLKTPEEVERELGVTTLGLLPEISVSAVEAPYGKKRKRGRARANVTHPELIVHEHPQSSVAEAARALRTNLTFMSPDRPFKTLLLTSAAPAEGKTTVACCVAVALAQAGHKVAIVDCDLRRARVHRVFKCASEVGMTTAVLEGSIQGALTATDVPHLDAMPAGPIPPNPAELLQSQRFRDLLEQLEQCYDRVVIDSPPVGAVTDAAVLSTMVDATLLVVRAYATNREVVRHALKSLRKVGTPVTGCILNAVDLDRHEYRASHYYYARDYYGERRDDAAASA